MEVSQLQQGLETHQSRPGDLGWVHETCEMPSPNPSDLIQLHIATHPEIQRPRGPETQRPRVLEPLCLSAAKRAHQCFHMEPALGTRSMPSEPA